ncbi:MAG: class I tRNA ligase family protein [Candidatus Hodgkinia cicadicola]
MLKFAIYLPKTQRPYRNESALLYQRANAAYKSASAVCRKRFNVLDGPPYANGEIHIGHIINKLLKQIVTLSQDQLGKRSALRANWDCHGLPIELEALKLRQQTEGANFLCRVYALNWIKTQIAQLKLIGLKCYKPRTSMSAQAQLRTLSKLYNLIKLKRLALGKRSVIWSLNENSSISENDAEQQLATITLADILNTIAARRQIKRANSATISELMLMQLSNNHKLLGKALLSTHCQVWSLPWTACVSLPNTNFKIYNTKAVSACKTKLASLTQIEPMAVGLIRSLNVLNLFSKKLTPIANWQSVGIQTVDLTTKLRVSPKLIYVPTSPFEYKLECFKGSAFNKHINTTRAEIRVVNKLITHSLAISVYTKPLIALRSVRSRGPATNWIDTQLYIKLNQSAKASVIDALSNVNVYPKAHKALLTNLIQTRPDWTISRQRVWGMPLCALINARSKIMLNKWLQQRIKQLFRFHKESQWHKLRTLYNKCIKQNWRQVTDVADVWFDASSAYSLRTNPKTWELVIEGIDQHRGWFQSMLINSALTTNKAPIKAIITHGFVMYTPRQKLSKSLPTKLARTLLKQLASLNTNIVRVWSCIVNPFENQIISTNWLLKSKAVYIKLNNTLKWGLGATLSAPWNNYFNLDISLLTPAAKLVLHKLKLYNNRAVLYYTTYRLNEAINAAIAMCNSLSIYFDCIKDQMYCDFSAAANRLNSAAVVKCAIFQVATWLTPIVPDVSHNIKNQLRLSNNVISPLPSKWFSKRIMANWNAISKLKKLISKLQLQASHTLPEVCINIHVSNKLTLRTFKNTDAALVLGCAKANIIWTARINAGKFAKLSQNLAISIWRTELKACARCRRKLYPNEY